MYLIRWIDLGLLEKSSELTTQRVDVTPELTARRIDVTERGPASRLLEKVEQKKSVGKRSNGEGP